VLVSLDTRLQQRYAHSSPDPAVTWSLGSAVAAYYEEMFYRAKIVGFHDDGIEVLLLCSYLLCIWTGLSGLVAEIIQATGDIGTQWILDLCCSIVKKVASQRIGSQVQYYQFTKGKGIQWSVDLTEELSCWNML